MCKKIVHNNQKKAARHKDNGVLNGFFFADFRHYVRNRYMEPHRQACGTSCYAQTGDILSKEYSPTAKAVVLCVEG